MPIFSPIRPSSGHFAHFSYTNSQNLARSAQLRHVMSWELLRVRQQMSLFWKGDNQGYKTRRNKNLDPGLHPFGWSCPQIDEGFTPSCTTILLALLSSFCLCIYTITWSNMRILCLEIGKSGSIFGNFRERKLGKTKNFYNQLLEKISWPPKTSQERPWPPETVWKVSRPSHIVWKIS